MARLKGIYLKLPIMIQQALYHCPIIFLAGSFLSAPIGLGRDLSHSYFAQVGNENSGREPDQNISLLEIGKPFERELSGGDVHVYEIRLAAGQYLHMVVEQRGIDIVATVIAPDGKKLAEVDSPNGTQGPEPVLVITDVPGSYRVEVRSLSKEAPPGRYRIEIRELRKATSQDRTNIAAASEVKTLVAEGEKLYSQGTAESIRQSLEKFERALPLWRMLEDRAGEAQTLANLGDVYDSIGDEQKSLDHYNLALPIFRELRDQLKVAEVLNNIGYVYWIGGEKQKALQYHNEALILRQAKGYRKGQAESFNNIGIVYADLGENQKALDYYKKALPLWETVNDQRGIAITLTNIGYVYSQMGRYEKALDYYLQTLAPLRALKDPAGEANTLNNIGGVFYTLGKEQNALTYFNQALQLRREVGDRRGEAITLNNIGGIYDHLGNQRKALEYFKESLPIRRMLKDRQGEARMLYRIGSAYLDLGDVKNAFSYYSQALPIWREIHNSKEESHTLIGIGKVYYKQGDKQKALDFYDQALSRQRAISYQEGEAITLENLGYVYEAEKNFEKAFGFFKESISIQEKIRNAARLEETRDSIAAQAADVYQHAILTLIRLGNHNLAFEYTERARSRTLLDQIGNSRINIRKGADPKLLEKEQKLQQDLARIEKNLRQELTRPQPTFSEKGIQSLRSKYIAKQQEYDELIAQYKLNNAEYASLRSVDILPTSEVQKLVSRHTTLLSYFVLQDEILAFIITRQRIQVVELHVRQQDLEMTINDLRGFANLHDIPIGKLKELYGYLIKPIKKYLTTQQIGIIPHSILHYVPFVCLTDGHRYLGDDHTLFYIPSVSALEFIRQKRKANGNRLLILAQNKAEGLPILHHAENEAKAIAKLNKTQAIVGDAATETRFRSRAGDYNILHIAAHAELNKNMPFFSRIILVPDAAEDGALEVHEIYDLELIKANLVVLSACQTNLGKYSHGDDVFALDRAFIYAGAPTIISSLWIVDDKATGDLMISFYRHLKRGMSKADALRAAQAETRVKYPHPYYWAAFVLTGDPGN